MTNFAEAQDTAQALFGAIELEAVTIGGEVIGYTAAKRAKRYFLALDTKGVPAKGQHKTREDAEAAVKGQSPKASVQAAPAAQPVRSKGLTARQAELLTVVSAYGDQGAKVYQNGGCYWIGQDSVRVQGRTIKALEAAGKVTFDGQRIRKI